MKQYHFFDQLGIHSIIPHAFFEITLFTKLINNFCLVPTENWSGRWATETQHTYRRPASESKSTSLLKRHPPTNRRQSKLNASKCKMTNHPLAGPDPHLHFFKNSLKYVFLGINPYRMLIFSPLKSFVLFCFVFLLTEK
jgi:hypothetical protein